MASTPNESRNDLSRRDLMKTGAAAALIGTGLLAPDTLVAGEKKETSATGLLVVSTWPFGLKANTPAVECLQQGGEPIDAVEQGVRVTEADPTITSVGYGGRPNAQGKVQLDAAVMNGADLRCGGVAALEKILHPVSVARKVMEETPHVLLVGEGALSFARSRGFRDQEMLTPGARKAWEKWKARNPEAVVPHDNDDHDTIGMIARDEQGRLAAAVTTSGLAYKLPGRVGDSPLIGCGLYADDTAGAAVATGVGEEAIRVLGSFLTVEFMRRGASPLDAVMETLKRVRTADGGRRGAFQLAFLAVGVDGRIAGGGLQKGFSYAVSNGAGRHEVVQGETL